MLGLARRLHDVGNRITESLATSTGQHREPPWLRSVMVGRPHRQLAQPLHQLRFYRTFEIQSETGPSSLREIFERFQRGR
jgi:hypothetical protein